MTDGTQVPFMCRDARQRARVDALVRHFGQIAQIRMAGLPMMNPRLSVEAVGFEPVRGLAPEAMAGILLTPWFMNLVWLPMTIETTAFDAGAAVERAVGEQVFEFLPSLLEGIGRIEACSLFSPMDEFATQEDARETALEILRMLRTAPARPADGGQMQAVPPRRDHALARRQFLFGRLRPGA